MATTATQHYLGTLQKGTTDIGQLISFTAPKRVRGVSNTTHLASTAQHKTNKPGWITPGEATFTLHLITADYTTLNTDFEAGTISTYRVRYNDGSGPTTGTAISFSAWLRELGQAQLTESGDDTIQVEGVLNVTGVHTYAAAT